MSIYVSWSYPAEAGRNPAELDNRFSTMTEVRRVTWPAYEDPQWSDPLRFQQGIAGGLELFFRGWLPFQQFVEETTGHPVPVYQRVDQAGFHTPLDERVLADTDTLFVWGLDHMITGQDAAPEEIEALRQFLTREGACLVLGPHHDVGASDDLAVRDMEHHHHGDALVPRQQQFGRYTRSLMKGLGVPVENRYGLRPAVQEPGKIAPLSVSRDLDTKGWLEGVTHFNFHMHLPHYAVTTDDPNVVFVLGRQPIDMSKPHPFTEAGNTEFNMFLWMPPSDDRAGDVLLADTTIFSTLFGADESLRAFWANIVSSK
ncbi:hypothetical protein AB0H34_36145 [Saccharopolyspora shandongensis]|uniref:hypothetical protein n=1 Tax=Saccharopolyspora shandongensis TaxID=418495 RepID=UPI0033E8C69D